MRYSLEYSCVVGLFNLFPQVTYSPCNVFSLQKQQPRRTAGNIPVLIAPMIPCHRAMNSNPVDALALR
jgi:hypothetical protein